MKLKQSKELNWINAVKAICMIGVFYIHGQLYYDLWIGHVHRYIHPWYVNAFFMVSGYLLFRKQLSNPEVAEIRQLYLSKYGSGVMMLKNIFYRLWLPSLIFSVIEFVPKRVINGGDVRFVEELLTDTIGGGTYWFVSALIICELIVLFLLVTRVKNFWFYFVALAAITLFFTMFGDNHRNLSIAGYYSWRQALLACIFLGFGGLYWKYEYLFDKLQWKHFILLAIIFFIVFTYFSDKALVLVSHQELNLLGLFGSFIGCVILFFICKRLPKIRLLTFIGRNSILFYFMSGAVPITTNILIRQIYPDTSLSVFILYQFCIIVCAITLTYVISTYLPFMTDIRKIL